MARTRIGPAPASPSRGASRLRMLAGSVAGPFVGLWLGFSPALASSVAIPDDFATIQQGIDSGADTVLVREGTHPERPVVHRALVLLGTSTDRRPQLAGLQVYNTDFWYSPALLSVARLEILGRVHYETIYYRPRGLALSFVECALDSGLQISNQDAYDIATVWFYKCRIGATSTGQADHVFMSADTVNGGVAWRARGADITDCLFRGGTGRAIELTGDAVWGPIARNRIENYGVGIYAENVDLYTIADNIILNCATGMELRSAAEVNVTRNVVRGCGIGVLVDACDGLTVRENSILASTWRGMDLSYVNGAIGLIAEDNVVASGLGDGIVLQWGADQVVLRTNTIVGNRGSGLVMTEVLGQPITVERNIVAWNGGWALTVSGGGVVGEGCNDWFENGGGPRTGGSADSTDLSVDPLFCDSNGEDFRLNSASPLVDGSSCGQIGALGVGCGETPTLVQRFTAGRVGEGIRVAWQVTAGASASEIWVERSEAMEGAGWTRPLTERSRDGETAVDLDRSAAADRPYWYRLVAQEGSETVVIGAPIAVEAQPRLEFRLAEVGPSPGSGPVRIAFSLARAAEIEIDVFDVQGRQVASLARGVWPGGRQAVEWNGRAPGGQAAPAGLYVLRYRYPGGQDRRAIVRVR